jgi:diacylglycerol O-acyltransferase / wax synthase
MSTRFSSADTAWLHMDRPTNLMVINSVLLFDEPVDWERLKQVTQRRMVDRYPRFRQHVVESRLPLRPPAWQDDPDFALEHHMHHLALPAPGNRAALQELVSDMMVTPLDHSRPLWQVYLVDGFGEGAAIISRMHHCIADGIALARVMLSLTDSGPEVGTGPAQDERLASGPRGGLTGRGEVTVGLMVDAALIPDPEQIVIQLERELESLARPTHDANATRERDAGQRPTDRGQPWAERHSLLASPF